LAAGVGLNITAANHVIHFTRHWNPAKEAQATDRAYRIGQKKPVHIYYPMSLSEAFQSFDSVLHLLLERKQNLASSTLTPTQDLTTKEFMGLLQNAPSNG
jgi:SNF2 family DNA or RNA helicase